VLGLDRGYPQFCGTLPFVHIEQSLIGAFVKRSKRDRYREILENPRLRHKFTHKLAHFTDFDPKYRLPISSVKLFIENIAIELRKRHSPTVVYAISEDPTRSKRAAAHGGSHLHCWSRNGHGPFVHSKTPCVR
jgi:hypothetical protein